MNETTKEVEDVLHLDFETYSEAPLVGTKSVGGYKYAEHPSTEILIMAVAHNDSMVFQWNAIHQESCSAFEAVELLRKAVKEGWPIYAHNAPFEDAICINLLQKTFGIEPPAPGQWRCTAAMARRAAIPSSLAQCGEFLGIEKAKDTSGKKLIALFSSPRKPTKKDPRTRILPSDEPEEFQRFVDYCVQDVEAEREVQEKLKVFEKKGAVLESFQFDFRMNRRGIPVNVEALQHTQNLIEEFESREKENFKNLMGFESSQTKVCTEAMQNAGYPFADLTVASVGEVLAQGATGWSMRYIGNETRLECVEWQAEEREKVKANYPAKPNKEEKKEIEKIVLKNTPKRLKTKKLLPVEIEPKAFEALQVRAMLSFAAAKKILKMLSIVCKDGTAKGCHAWAGAERTHRWAGRMIQPQNFKRSTKTSELAYKMLCEGVDLETMELLFGNFLETVASAIRHFIKRPEGQLLQADFSSVEGRGAPWLCGGEDKLNRFRRGEPIYEGMASKIFNVPTQQVVDENEAGNTEKRFIGKQAELGCNYNMGWPKFRGTCENFKYKPSQAMIDAYKPIFSKQLKHLLEQANGSEPWDEKQVKFAPYNFAKLYNRKEGGQFAGRAVQVWTYRKGGTKRLVENPLEPTAEEWADLTYDNLAYKAVTAWRKDNPEVVTAWKTIDACAKDAMRNPGKWVQATPKIKFMLTKKVGFLALVMKLPSGHLLVYPRAKLVWKATDENKGKTPDKNDNYNTEIQFWGKHESRWCWCSTYGGKLLENATQAICGDFMANGAVKAEKAGFDAYMLVHDELIGPQKEGQTHEELCKHLCDLPEWAEGMPLEAEGNLIPYYMKT